MMIKRKEIEEHLHIPTILTVDKVVAAAPSKVAVAELL